jgi:hypothetical protein
MIQHFMIMPFLAGIVLGGAILYFYKSPPRTVIEYPHPQNVKERVYRDQNGVCYSYTAEKVDCDANEATLKPYPIQA